MSETDAKLRSLLAAGTSKEFDLLVSEFTPRLWRHLIAMGHDKSDAEDLVQETYLHAWQQRHRYDDRWAVSTWLFTIARNLGVNRFRRRQSFEDRPMTELVAAEQAESHPLADGLWEQARRLLDARSFQALWLRYGDDLSHEDVAQFMGITAGNVRVIIHRAKLILADALEIQENIS